MTPVPFEQHLSRQPLRPVPAEWRAEVLSRAGDLQSPSAATATTADGGCKPPARASQLREWLWPCPQAWAALAAVWVLLLAVNFADDSKPARSTQSATKSAPADMHYVWREQQKLLAELFPPEPVAPPQPRTQPPPALPATPRSELSPSRSREEEIA